MSSLTEAYVREMFSLLEAGDGKAFMEKYVKPDVDWLVTGSQNPLSGKYRPVLHIGRLY